MTREIGRAQSILPNASDRDISRTFDAYASKHDGDLLVVQVTIEARLQ